MAFLPPEPSLVADKYLRLQEISDIGHFNLHVVLVATISFQYQRLDVGFDFLFHYVLDALIDEEILTFLELLL